MRPPVRISAAWKTTNVQPRHRYARPSRAKKSHASPAIQMGAVSGSIARASCPSSASGFRTTSRWLRRMFSSSSSIGKPWRAIQTKFGRKISPATAPPIQIPGFANARRAGVSSRPRTTAKPKTSVVCLLRRPRPISAPKPIHSRSLPVWIHRITQSAAPIQKSGSKAFIVRRWSMPR